MVGKSIERCIRMNKLRETNPNVIRLYYRWGLGAQRLDWESRTGRVYIVYAAASRGQQTSNRANTSSLLSTKEIPGIKFPTRLWSMVAGESGKNSKIEMLVLELELQQ